MLKKYHIATPEQLKELNTFAKEGSAAPMATVWSTKLRKDGSSPWDNAIFAIFETDNGRKAWIGRKARIVREVGTAFTSNVSLKYTPALKWCEDNLKRVE